MFSLGFPLLILVTFINNIFEMMIDKEKVMSLTWRPIPASAKNLGIFYPVFNVLSFIAVFTNIGIMSFTGKAFGENNQYSSFLWFTIVTLFLKFFISEIIPDISETSVNIAERHKYIVKKTLVSLGSEKEGSRFKSERINLQVMFTDFKGAPVAEPIQDSPADSRVELVDKPS